MELTPAEQKLVEALTKRDREVRSHEMAHKTVGGSWAGPISFTYRVGPDRQRYVVDGEVAIDLSAVANNPEATARKMQQVRRAALAPVTPSTADRQVAAQAAALEKAASAEVRAARQAAADGDEAEGTRDLRSGPVAHVTRALLAPRAIAAYAKWAAEARYESQASPTLLAQF